MIKEQLNNKKRIIAINSTIRTALFKLSLQRALLNRFTDDICEELENLYDGSYILSKQKRSKRTSIFILSILIFFILSSIAS